jgi:hypothetical protein
MGKKPDRKLAATVLGSSQGTCFGGGGVMEKPMRVQRCTTHHHACDCREWRFEQMKRKLESIQNWALFCLANERDLRPGMQWIADQCQEVLKPKGENDE